MQPVLLFLLVNACFAAPLPPIQTAKQIEAVSRLSALARRLSPSATKEVLLVLDSAAFRKELTVRAPILAKLPSVELLARYRAEVSVTEITHAFQAKENSTQLNALDVSIDIELFANWFYNQWQLPLLFPEREEKAYYQLVSYLAPAGVTETGLWNMTSFTGSNPLHASWPGGWPANLLEASDRVVYTLFNQHKVDFPGFNWGDTVVVFNNSYVKDMIMFAPIDTGDVSIACNSTFTSDFCNQWANVSACEEFWYCEWHNGIDSDIVGNQCRAHNGSSLHNCSSGYDVVGTADDFDHLILPYASWYGNSCLAAGNSPRLSIGTERNSWPSGWRSCSRTCCRDGLMRPI
jgi:hypothetical protein